MQTQVGLEVLEYERQSLVSANHGLTSGKCSAEITAYTIKLDELRAEQNHGSNLVSEDALEFLYQDFLSKELASILESIESFYDSCVDDLLTSGVAHFTVSARRIAKYTLTHHAAECIVSHFLTKRRLKDLSQAGNLLRDELLPGYDMARINYIISNKYDYFEERIKCCLEIGNKIRSL